MDRVILVVGFVLFSLAVLYVVSKRIGLLKLQRKIIEAVKVGTMKDIEIVPRAPQVNEEAVPKFDISLEEAMHDEL